MFVLVLGAIVRCFVFCHRSSMWHSCRCGMPALVQGVLALAVLSVSNMVLGFCALRAINLPMYPHGQRAQTSTARASKLSAGRVQSYSQQS